jgi:glycosyltransferase involved in cell wall biosynthesis
MRPRVLVVHPVLGITGGGNVVAAWTLEALREDFAVTLATLEPVDCAGLNRNFGTSLRESDFAVRMAPASFRKFLARLPFEGAQMRIALTGRWARQLDARERFDVLLSTHNEIPFGRPGLQYVHFPWAYFPRPDIEMQWFHRFPGVLRAYRGVSQWIAGGTAHQTRINRSLANSQFVAGKIREYYGVESTILYPPVPGEFPDVPWAQRRNDALAIGRLHPIKRWERAVEIVEQVRRDGAELGLTLIHPQDDLEYGRKFFAMASTRPWFRLLTGLTRQQLVKEVAQHRFGIHTMEDEHFGIAVAEMVRAGCIPMVHDSGGPVEIVGGRSELRFRSVAEGVEKLRVLTGDSAAQERLRAVLAKQRELFSADRFCDSLREIVSGFYSGITS